MKILQLRKKNGHVYARYCYLLKDVLILIALFTRLIEVRKEQIVALQTQ